VLAETANAAIVEPRAAANRTLMRRAIEAAYRVLILQKPVDRAFLISLIDGVILPAVGLGGPQHAPD
jgi:hypothetical protein